MCYRTGKYTVCRSVHASFRPDILQAGAVKGLIAMYFDEALMKAWSNGERDVANEAIWHYAT